MVKSWYWFAPLALTLAACSGASLPDCGDAGVEYDCVEVPGMKSKCFSACKGVDKDTEEDTQ